MNRHGGVRAGAGRKPGPQGERQKTKDRRRVMQEAASGGMSPLDILLDVARRYYKAKEYDKAAAVAAEAAPYLHPKLSNISHAGRVGIELELVEKIIDVPEPSAN